MHFQSILNVVRISLQVTLTSIVLLSITYTYLDVINSVPILYFLLSMAETRTSQNCFYR